ncbi:hypothetical protein DID88_001024 [Monilinia fructigena]|uniref:Uncharacterized protein n=1 Tax=Monilinia fructigena TaxID=38457 RepID=A0A395J068_9HELO|nr:hypothetical protein DID88_001024 [Monilinia fructigena]
MVKISYILFYTTADNYNCIMMQTWEHIMRRRADIQIDDADSERLTRQITCEQLEVRTQAGQPFVYRDSISECGRGGVSDNGRN